MSHVAYERVMSRNNELCHICMSHVPWYLSFDTILGQDSQKHTLLQNRHTDFYKTDTQTSTKQTHTLLQNRHTHFYKTDTHTSTKQTHSLLQNRHTHFYKTDTHTSTKQTHTSTKQTHRLLQNRHTHFYKTDTQSSTKQTHRLLQNRHTHFCKTETQTSTKQRHRLLLNIDLDQDSHSNRFSSLPRISEKRTPLQSTDRWQYSRALHCRKRALCFQRRLPQEPYISAKEICILAKEPYITAKEP